MSAVKKKLGEIAEFITAEKAFYLLIMITMISLPLCELLVEQHSRNFEGQPVIVEAAGIMGAVMVVTHLVIHKGISYYPTDVFFALLVIFAGLSLAFTEDMLSSVQGYDYDEWLTHFMAYFSLMYAGTMVKDKKRRRNIIRAFVFVLILQGAVGVMQSLGSEFTNCFYDADAATELHLAYGLTAHYNWYAALMTLAAGCAMGLCVFAGSRKSFLAALAGSALGMYALLATETRLALLSLAVLIVFYPAALLIYKLKNRDSKLVKPALLHWGALALLLAALLLLFFFGLGRFRNKLDLTISEMNGTATFSQDSEKIFGSSSDSSESDESAAAISQLGISKSGAAVGNDTALHSAGNSYPDNDTTGNSEAPERISVGDSEAPEHISVGDSEAPDYIDAGSSLFIPDSGSDTDTHYASDLGLADDADTAVQTGSAKSEGGLLTPEEEDPLNGLPESEKYTAFDNFATGRGHIWKYGLACVPSHWAFGVGLDNYRWCFTHAPDLPHDTWSQGKGHNELIHYLVTQGVFQLLTILSLVIYTFTVGIRTALNAEDKQERILSFILIGMVTGYFVQSMFNSSVVNIAPYYWITIGLVLCKTHQRPFGYRNNKNKNKTKIKEQAE